MIRSFLLAVVLLASLALIDSAPAQTAPPTSPQYVEPKRPSRTNVFVDVLNEQGTRVRNLKAGETARVVVTADIGRIPNAVGATVTARAIFTTAFLGRPVSYELRLPSMALRAGSTLNPAVGTLGFRTQKVGADWQNQPLIEEFSLPLPPETPRGTLNIRVRLNATGLAPLSRDFRFAVTR